MPKGVIYGVGLGPGDSELMSVKADRLVRNTRHIAYFRKAGRAGQARRIVTGLLRDDICEFAMEYPVTTEIPLTDPRYNEILAQFYRAIAAHLQNIAEKGEDVVVLCEGDPFFYGSFMHLYTRLKDHTPIEVVPAITGMSGAWTATGMPITWGDDVLSVLMGTLPEEALISHLQQADAVVIMKIGRHLEKLRRALRAAGRYEAAWIVEYACQDRQTVQLLSEFNDKPAPYFSIIILHGNGRRP